MFTAMVLACAIGMTNTCVEATDELGPYETKEQCVMRVHQMIATMQATFPVPHSYRYKCVEQSITKKGISL
jgi:hypothetical protein